VKRNYWRLHFWHAASVTSRLESWLVNPVICLAFPIRSATYRSVQIEYTMINGNPTKTTSAASATAAAELLYFHTCAAVMMDPRQAPASGIWLRLLMGEKIITAGARHNKLKRCRPTSPENAGNQFCRSWSPCRVAEGISSFFTSGCRYYRSSPAGRRLASVCLLLSFCQQDSNSWIFAEFIADKYSYTVGYPGSD